MRGNQFFPTRLFATLFSDKENLLFSYNLLLIKKIFHCYAVIANGKCLSHEHREMEKRVTMKGKVVLSAVLFLTLLQSGNELLKTSVWQYMDSKVSF